MLDDSDGNLFDHIINTNNLTWRRICESGAEFSVLAKEFCCCSGFAIFKFGAPEDQWRELSLHPRITSTS